MTELAEFKVALDAWLDEHESDLTPDFEGLGSLDQQVATCARSCA